MKKHKLKFNYLILGIIFLILALLLSKVILSLFNGEVVYEDGSKVSRTIGYVLLLPLFSWLYSSINLFIHYFKHNQNAYILNEDGIENTTIMIIFLAFIFIVPVKKIPWEAVEEINKNKDCVTLKINPQYVEANFLAKLIICFRGYDFLYYFSNPYIDKYELSKIYYILKNE